MNLCVVPHINTHTVFPENPFRKVHKCQKIIKFYPKKMYRQYKHINCNIFCNITARRERERN